MTANEKASILKEVFSKFFFIILIAIISTGNSFSSPFRPLPLPLVGYYDAEGVNSLCGAQDVVLDALGMTTTFPGITYTYQWQHWVGYPTMNWINYASGTNRTITVSFTSAPASTQVRCKVVQYTSGVKSSEWTTGTATLQVADNKPNISANPINLTICEGQAASFSSTFNGSYFTYQWYEITPLGVSTPISGATSNTVTLSPNPPFSKNQYHYKCVASNGCGDTPSGEAILTVDIQPSINTGLPANFEICEGLPSSFSVSTNNTAYINSYNWQYRTSGTGGWADCSTSPAYQSYNTQTLSISNSAKTMNGYQFQCVITGKCGFTGNSQVATLTVKDNPVITLNPVDQTKCSGEQVSYTASATGYGVAYTWERKVPGGSYQPIDGTVSATYTHNCDVTENGNYYKCKAYNSCSYAYTSEATGKLTVNTPPVLNSMSDDISVCEGAVVIPSFTANFSNNVTNVNFEKSENSGSTWVSIQSSNPGGATSSSYTLPNTSYSLNGFLYRVTVSGSCPPVATSAARMVTIKKQPVITSPPANITACIGAQATLSVSATGNGLEYKWRRAGATYLDWSGTKDLIITPISSGDATQWDVLVRNECSDQSGIDSDDATITVNPKPTIELGADKKICTGSSVVLNAGSGFKSYLWSTGATTKTISVTTQGPYTATVTDNNDCSASDVISVFVDPPLPVIDLGPDKTLCKGDSIVLDASDQYDSYLWNTASEEQSIKVKQSGTYSITAGWNSSVCKATDEINITFAVPYEDENICMVMTDPETEKNLVIWEKTPDVGTQRYEVWKVAGAGYSLVTETLEADTSTVIDWSSKPRSKTDAYVLVTIDTCGNASQRSPWHKPFFLQSGIGLNNVINLNWEPYLIDGTEYVFKSLVIYRGTDSTKLVPIDTIAGGIGSVSYTDENPPLNIKVFYRIGGEKEVPCDPNHILGKKTSRGPYVHSLSNLEDNRLETTGISGVSTANSLKIQPNPMKTEALIQWKNPGGAGFDLFIYDLNGRIVKSESGLNTSQYHLQRENLNPGCYIVELRGKNSSRTKLLVE